MKEHWEKVYGKNAHIDLGWYEEYSIPSLDLIRLSGIPKDGRILIAGVGASTLIDGLLYDGYTNIIANDVSEKALKQARDRLGPEMSSQVKWLVDDLTKPKEMASLDSVHLWHDRAVLHFFTELADQYMYFNLLKKLLDIQGYAIIASFNLEGAEKCSGLPVQRYNTEMLQDRMGHGFELVKDFNHIHTMPGGDSRDYVYTLFRRIS